MRICCRIRMIFSMLGMEVLNTRCKDSSKDFQQENDGTIYRCNARAVSRCWLGMLGRLMLRQRSNVFFPCWDQINILCMKLKCRFNV